MGKPLNVACKKRKPARQRGFVLFVALIALVVMTLAAIGLVRNFDTSTAVIGNLTFKSAGVSAIDVGGELAVAALPAFAAAGNTTVPHRYFATLQPVVAGSTLPVVNWNASPCFNMAGAIIACPLGGITGQEVVQYVIERMCTATPGTPDNCVVAQLPPDNTPGPLLTGTPPFYYRITVRVLGPRNTVTFGQMVVGLV